MEDHTLFQGETIAKINYQLSKIFLSRTTGPWHKISFGDGDSNLSKNGVGGVGLVVGVGGIMTNLNMFISKKCISGDLFGL